MRANINIEPWEEGAFSPPIVTATMSMNQNCDGGRCRSSSGEVRLLPKNNNPHSGNIILCHSCYEHEMWFRRERNKGLHREYRFELPSWESLGVYKT